MKSEASKQRAREQTKERYATDVEYRERCKAYSKEYGKLNKEILKVRAKKQFLKNRYNLSVEEHDALFEKADFKCEICGKELIKSKTGCGPAINSGCVDHCHSSKKIRGILCTNCNSGIGKLQENITVLENAISYLKRNNLAN